jgi:hypothetical protein
MLNTRMTATPPVLVTATLWWLPLLWVARRQHRLLLQTLLTLAVLALLPGCAADRSVGEATASVGDDVRSLQSKVERGTRNAESSQTLVISAAPNAQPVVLQGRVLFHGAPPPELEIPLPAPVFAARTNAPLKTRFHRVSPEGGLADVLVYVKAGLTNQTFTAPTNTHLIRIQRHEYQPYITAVQAGQVIRWESDIDLNFHPTPTNRANREFNRALMPSRPVEAIFPAPELFLRTKDDVHPWLFGYVSVLPHPFFAVTDAAGRFRFPHPLSPGKYTLAAVHRRAGEAEQMLALTQPLSAGASVPSVEFHFNAPPGGATPPSLASVPQRPAPPPPANFTPSVPPTHEELLERKARVQAEIKAMEKVLLATHPKMVGLRKQLESIEEALKQTPPVKPGAANPSLQPSPQTPDAKPQTPDPSQSLVTSAPTAVQLAAASPGGIRLPVPNPYFRTNAERPFLTHSSKGAQLINRKLDQIVLPEIHFDGVPLKDVVKRLADDAKQFDPEKKGLNFLINDVNRTALTAAPAVDPNGNPMPAAQPVPLSETLVHLSLPLKGLTLREALDAICKTSEGGAGFAVEEYAVAFIPRGPGASALFSRTFRVSPDAFMQGLQGVVASPVIGVQAGQPTTANGAGGQPAAPAGGVGAAGPVRAVVPPAVPAMQNNANSANTLVRQFFQSAGVSGLSAPNSGTRVQFNPQTGALVVQGTAADLRAVEQALGKLGANPPPAP